MLTFKHIMDNKEFAREIGSYTIDRRNDRITIQCFENDEDSECLGIWGGFQFHDSLPEDLDQVQGRFYIMNSAGSTVANGVYYAAATSLVGTKFEQPKLPEDEMQEAA